MQADRGSVTNALVVIRIRIRGRTAQHNPDSAQANMLPSNQLNSREHDTALDRFLKVGAVELFLLHAALSQPLAFRTRRHQIQKILPVVPADLYCDLLISLGNRGAV